MSVDSSLGAPPRGSAIEFTTRVTERARPDRTRLLALGALVSLPLLGLLICIAGTKTNSILPQSVRPAVSWFAGPFRFIGFPLTSGEVIIVNILMFTSYWMAIKHSERFSAKTVLIVVAAFNVIVLLGPPLISTDVFSYQAYGKMWTTYATNPYLHGPSVIQLDPIYSFIGSRWIYTPSVYGPLFTLMSGIWAGVSTAVSMFIFKAIAGLSCAGTLWLLWHSAKLRGVDPVKAVALFGLNPLVVVYGVGGGHNDLLMLMLTTAGIYMMLRGHERSSGVLVIAGAAIKLTGGVLAPFMLLSGAVQGRGRWRKSVLVGALACGTIVAAAGFAVFGTGLLHMPTTLSQVQNDGGWQSIPGLLFTVLRVPVTRAGTMAFGLIFVSICVWLMWRVYQGRLDWLEGAAWATVALLMTAGAVLPWYIAWLIPVVALCADPRLWKWAIRLTVLVGLLTSLQFVPTGIPFLGI